MPSIALTFVNYIDRFNYLVGRVMMYGIFVLMAISKQLFVVPAYKKSRKKRAFPTVIHK